MCECVFLVCFDIFDCCCVCVCVWGCVGERNNRLMGITSWATVMRDKIRENGEAMVSFLLLFFLNFCFVLRHFNRRND